MKLENVFKDIPDLLDKGVLFRGPDQVEHHSAPPSISWEPVSAKHSPPRRIGGGARNDGDLWQREVTVALRIWGATLADTEALLLQFVNAAHYRLSQHSYQLAGEEWHTGGDTAKGVECVLTMTVLVPLARTQEATREVTAINPTYEVNGNQVLP